jgi:ribosomal protein S18 acetylase RimI-like enzyme
LIKNLNKEDKEDLLRILKDTEHFDNNEIKVAEELIDVYLNNPEQEDYIIYVYKNEDGKTAGYVCYGRRPLTDATYDLYWIAVDPTIHGKGIGSSLVKHMESDLIKRSGNLVLIETSGKTEYEGERKFYLRNGYEVQTIIKDFYRYGDDLYVYRKYLKEKLDPA